MMDFISILMVVRYVRNVSVPILSAQTVVEYLIKMILKMGIRLQDFAKTALLTTRIHNRANRLFFLAIKKE